jgi:hypothetical protein
MTRKLRVRKHIRALPRGNAVPTESHTDGQRAGYFPRTLWTLLLMLEYSEPPLFVGKPPTFSHAVEPMDADDWLKSIEKKLQVVQCNNHERVLLTSHQLSGPVAD